MHRCCATGAAHNVVIFAKADKECLRLRGYVGESAASRAAQTTKSLSKNRSGQVVAGDALVKTLKIAAEFIQEGGNDLVLIIRAIEIVREAAPGLARRDFGPHHVTLVRRAAYGSDAGTCKANSGGVVSDLVYCLKRETKNYTYRFQGTWG